MTNQTLCLPNPGASLTQVDIRKIRFANVIKTSSGTLVLKIYLDDSSAVEAPATAANVEYLEGIGVDVKGKHLLNETETLDSPAPEPETQVPESQPEPPQAESIAGAESKKKGNRP